MFDLLVTKQWFFLIALEVGGKQTDEVGNLADGGGSILGNLFTLQVQQHHAVKGIKTGLQFTGTLFLGQLGTQLHDVG